MNGGLSVIDPRSGRYLRHLATGGVPEGLALDAKRRLVYAADLSSGRILALDASRLASSDPALCRKSLLGSLEPPPPAGAPLIRPAADFAIAHRSGTALHNGPHAVRLSGDGSRLFVLDRFARDVLEIDVRGARSGSLSLVRRWPIPNATAVQENRRLGEIIFHTDLGRSGMTCDTCHPAGHIGGVLYTKTRPIRIYRSPTCRAITESPPYFTPSLLPSIRATCEEVLDRNRYGNPPPTDGECAALGEYVEAIAAAAEPLPRGGRCAAGGVAPAGWTPRERGPRPRDLRGQGRLRGLDLPSAAAFHRRPEPEDPREAAPCRDSDAARAPARDAGHQGLRAAAAVADRRLGQLPAPRERSGRARRRRGWHPRAAQSLRAPAGPRDAGSRRSTGTWQGSGPERRSTICSHTS